MAIKIVLNGYFRSGTTLFWNILNNSFENYECFYEPLHPLLPRYISNLNLDDVNELHGLSLWREYNNFSQDELNSLMINHPNLYRTRFNKLTLLNYFNYFDSISKNSILQTNRIHFFLNDVGKEYNAKVIHVIREPYGVYKSLLKAYYNESKGLKKQLKKYLPLQCFSVFEIQDEFRWIVKHYGKPNKYFDKLDLRLKTNFSLFKMFCVVYTINNFFAINSIREKGLLLSYDKLIYNSTEELNKLLVFLDLDEGVLKTPPIKGREENILDKNKFYNEFEKCIKMFGLENEYNFVKVYFKTV